MKIYKFQNGTKDYEVGVLYSTHGEEMRLQSNDKPKSELYLHTASVVFLAEEFFGLKGLRAELKEIVFSSGQNGAQTGVTLSVITSQGKYAKMLLPKIDRAYIEDAKTHEVDPRNPRNAYNLAVDTLEASLVAYIQGRRQQAVLDFNAETTRNLMEGVDDLLTEGARLRSLSDFDDGNEDEDEDEDEDFDDEDDGLEDASIGHSGVEVPFTRALEAARAHA